MSKYLIAGTAALLAFTCLGDVKTTPSLSGSFISQASAKPQPTNSPIETIYFKEGRLVQTDKSQGIWTEYDFRGTERYQFNTLTYDANSLTLTGREGNVRLYINFVNNSISGEWPGHSMGSLYTVTRVENFKVTIPTPNSNIPNYVPPGKNPDAPVTVTPPIIATVSNPSTLAIAKYEYGSFEQLSGNEWIEKTQNGRVFNFNKIGHDARSVFLYDASRNLMVELDLNDKLSRTSVDGGGLKPLYPLTEMGPNKTPQISTPLLTPEKKGTLSALERSQCLAKGGMIERAGMLGYERCTITYKDAGNICIDSSNCEGKCIATLDNAQKATVSGTCQISDNPFGCYAEVVAGKTGPALCVD